MTEGECTEIQRIQWKTLFPWTLIFRSLAPAASVSVVLLATVGVMLNAIGWRVSEAIFVRDALRERAPATADFAERMRSPWQGIFESYQSAESLDILGAQINGPLLVFGRMVEPFLRLFESSGGLMRFGFLALGILLTVAIWAFFGTAIARIALFRYTRNESLPLDSAVRFACREYGSALACILVPLAAVAALAIPAFLIGLLMSFDLGLLLASLIYFLVLLLGLGMALLLLGLAFGWPLSISAVSAEGQGFFDGLTRSFAYTYQRPFSYGFYALVAVIAGGLTWIVVDRATVGVERLADWSTSWGANAANAGRMETIQNETRGELSWDFLRGAEGSAAVGRSWSFRAGTGVLHFWKSLLRTVAVGFLFGHFWCLAAAIYLLLRKQIDDAELDELFVLEEQRTYELPSLQETPPTVVTPRPHEPSSSLTHPSLAETTVPPAKPPSAAEAESEPQIDTDPER